jgi:flavodoxin
MIGHYIDHELVANIEHDVEKRIARIKNGEPIRILLSVGGAGAGAKQFAEMVSHLMPYVKEKKAALFFNFGDHKTMYEYLCEHVNGFKDIAKNFFDQYEEFTKFVESMENEKIEGVYTVYNQNIFEAVYSTNLLMRKCEALITKPSELAFYPVVKIMMRHIGGHEVYGAVNAQEYGDSTFECDTSKKMNEMLDRLLEDKDLLIHLNKRIVELKAAKAYDGGYEAVKLAVKGFPKE